MAMVGAEVGIEVERRLCIGMREGGVGMLMSKLRTRVWMWKGMEMEMAMGMGIGTKDGFRKGCASALDGTVVTTTMMMSLWMSLRIWILMRSRRKRWWW